MVTAPYRAPVRPDVVPLRAKLFRGLADPSRLSILEALRPEQQSVSAIVAETGLTQSNVSNHLACLLECGLVKREKRGKFAVYALADPRVEHLLALADDVIADIAGGLDTCARYTASEGSR